MADDAEAKVQGWLDRAVSEQVEEVTALAEGLLDSARAAVDEYGPFLGKVDLTKLERAMASLSDAIEAARQSGQMGRLLEEIGDLERASQEIVRAVNGTDDGDLG